MSLQNFTTKGSITPEETFGLPTPSISQETLNVQLESDGIKIGDNLILYDDVRVANLISYKSMFNTAYSLTLNDGVNNYILRIPNTQIAESLPYKINEINIISFWTGSRKFIKKGIIHGVGILLLTVFSSYVAVKYLNFPYENFEDISGLIYMLSLVFLGYIWKRQYGMTVSFSLTELEATYNLLRYSFGISIVVVASIMITVLKDIVDFSQWWWPLFILIFVPFALFAQTANITAMAVVGGVFCRNPPNRHKVTAQDVVP